MNLYKFIKLFLIIFCTSLVLNACGSLPKFPKPDWSKTAEPNAKKRSQQNVIDGKGIRLFKGKKGDGTFLFASSNPMWKASLETLSFISLANVDYSGGVIITDWYSEGNPNEAIKITIKFLSNEIRADGLIVNLYKRNCVDGVCSTKEINDDLIFEIRDKILKRAVTFKKTDDAIAYENRPKKVFSPKDDG